MLILKPRTLGVVKSKVEEVKLKFLCSILLFHVKVVGKRMYLCII